MAENIIKRPFGEGKEGKEQDRLTEKNKQIREEGTREREAFVAATRKALLRLLISLQIFPDRLVQPALQRKVLKSDEETEVQQE